MDRMEALRIVHSMAKAALAEFNVFDGANSLYAAEEALEVVEELLESGENLNGDVTL